MFGMELLSQVAAGAAAARTAGHIQHPAVRTPTTVASTFAVDAGRNDDLRHVLSPFVGLRDSYDDERRRFLASFAGVRGALAREERLPAQLSPPSVVAVTAVPRCRPRADSGGSLPPKKRRRGPPAAEAAVEVDDVATPRPRGSEKRGRRRPAAAAAPARVPPRPPSPLTDVDGAEIRMGYFSRGE